MSYSDLYSLSNFDFLARSFAQMHSQGLPVDLQAVTGNMDEEHRQWFYARYMLYCQGENGARALEMDH